MNNWKTLTGGGGSKMIIQGDYAIAAELHRVTVWKQEQLWLQQKVDMPQPGFPRLIGEQLYWGAGILDLVHKQWQEIPGVWATLASAALQQTRTNAAGYTPERKEDNGAAHTLSAKEYNDTGYTPLTNESALGILPHGTGYTPIVFAWSPDGNTVAVSVKWTGQPGPAPAKVLLLDKEGRLLQVLWEDGDLPVAALYITHKWVLAGTRQLRVFDKNTFDATLIPEKLPAVKIDMTADEKRWLLLQYDHIGLWDAATAKELHRWKGQWSDAAIMPDGRYIIAVDFEGKIYRVDTTAPYERQPLSAPGAVFSVAADNNRLLAFMDGAVVRLTTLL